MVIRHPGWDCHTLSQATIYCGGGKNTAVSGLTLVLQLDRKLWFWQGFRKVSLRSGTIFPEGSGVEVGAQPLSPSSRSGWIQNGLQGCHQVEERRKQRKHKSKDSAAGKGSLTTLEKKALEN